jgi:hypothetical protein
MMKPGGTHRGSGSGQQAVGFGFSSCPSTPKSIYSDDDDDRTPVRSPRLQESTSPPSPPSPFTSPSTNPSPSTSNPRQRSHISAPMANICPTVTATPECSYFAKFKAGEIGIAIHIKGEVLREQSAEPQSWPTRAMGLVVAVIMDNSCVTCKPKHTID